MKKIMALALAMVLALSLSVIAMAEEKPVIEFVTSDFTAEGQTQVVKVVAKNFGKVTALQFAFEYDETKLEIVECAVNAGLAGATVNALIPGEIYINWEALAAAPIDGELVVITFKAIADELGTTAFGFMPGEDIIFAGEDFLEIPAAEIEVPAEPAEVEIDYVHEHEWSDWEETKAPWCGVAGEQVRHCEAYNGTCDAEETEAIDALEHDWDAGVVQDALCGETADVLYTCLRCQETKTETGVVVEHDWDEGVVTTEPTCEEDGVRTHTCQRANCPVGTKTSVEPKLGHDWGDWVENVAPDCDEYGEDIRYCNRDRQHTETRPVEPLGHDWGEWDETKAPDCTNPGEKVHVCGVCGEEETGTIPALGHDWGEWVVVKEATISEDGEEKRVCKRDESHVETRVIKNLMFLDPTISINLNGGSNVIYVDGREDVSTDGGKTDTETNPNTGAPVMGAYAVVALAAAAAVCSKKNHK
ncbi:MAG: NPXTG-anchored protein [Oscillospiraceae bacterium]|nr:NPXTG-anchored protein [Oscillospiraceae bacterium]